MEEGRKNPKEIVIVNSITFSFIRISFSGFSGGMKIVEFNFFNELIELNEMLI